MCEFYCPEDALHVSPNTDTIEPADEWALAESRVLASYRTAIGWSKPTRHLRGVDLSYQLLPPPCPSLFRPIS